MLIFAVSELSCGEVLDTFVILSSILLPMESPVLSAVPDCLV